MFGHEQIAVVLGTRPEIIKLAPVIRALGKRAWVVHSGQHFDYELAGAFFTGTGLGEPDVVLEGIGGTSRADQIGAMTGQLGALFAERRPAAVIVQGDTNTTSAAAQAASYTGIPVVHVEAGLRSHDRNMPEELNRLVVGVLADLHCAATTHNVDNLVREGIPAERIALTGNTIVEATLDTIADAQATAETERAERCGPFVLATIHRPENTDDPDRLLAIIAELGALTLPTVLPLHPRTRQRMHSFGIDRLSDRIRVIDPIGHAEFLSLARQARLLISDSGGVQEECTVLKKPLIVVRNSTERPESIEAGFAHLVRPGPDIGATANRLLSDPDLEARLRASPSPYGDRDAASLIVDATGRLIEYRRRIYQRRTASTLGGEGQGRLGYEVA